MSIFTEARRRISSYDNLDDGCSSGINILEMNDESTVEAFYQAVAKLLKCDGHVYREFPFGRRTPIIMKEKWHVLVIIDLCP